MSSWKAALYRAFYENYDNEKRSISEKDFRKTGSEESVVATKVEKDGSSKRSGGLLRKYLKKRN